MESGLAGPWVESQQAEPESKECRRSGGGGVASTKRPRSGCPGRTLYLSTRGPPSKRGECISYLFAEGRHCLPVEQLAAVRFF